MLKQNGYRTAIFGKWHLGDEPDSTKRQGLTALMYAGDNADKFPNAVWNPAVQSTHVAPHTPEGLRHSTGSPEPAALRSEGGNIGSLDGSVLWRKQVVMHQRWTFWNPSPVQNDYIGFW
jgi:hypothetical protein